MNLLRLSHRFAARLLPSDEQLMWRVHAADDHAAFGELVERWRERVHGMCTRMMGGDASLGEDLVQAAFARIYEKRAEYRPSARFSTYLWRVAVNLCHDEQRRARTRCWFGSGAVGEGVGSGGGGEGGEAVGGPVGGVMAGLAGSEPMPSVLVAEREEGRLVRDAVMALPEPYRTVLVLRHYQDLKLREIAEVLEVPEGTVNSRMAEALTRLARVLGPRLQPEAARTGAAAVSDLRMSTLSSPDSLTP